MCEQIDNDAMSRLAPPMIWKEYLQREVRRGNPAKQVPFLEGQYEQNDDEVADADTGADTERPSDAPDSHVPRLLVVPEAACGGGGLTPCRGGGGSGAASSSHSNPPPPPPPRDPPRSKWEFHFYILGTPN